MISILKMHEDIFSPGGENILCLNRESTLVSYILGDKKLSFLYCFIVNGNLI